MAHLLYTQRGKSEINITAANQLHWSAWSSPNGIMVLEERTVSESIFHDPAIVIARPVLSVVDHPGKIESNIGCLYVNRMVGPNLILNVDEMTVSESIYIGSRILFSRGLPATALRKDFWPFLLNLLR